VARTLPDALAGLRDELAGLELGLELADAAPARRMRVEVAGQVDDYLLPRVLQMDAPLLMVVGGSTGAGKSTLVNSLVGSVISPGGVLRPTTLAPVLVCNPDDVRWFEDDRILPGLARTSSGPAAPGGLQLTPSAALPTGLALLDSPDIDSVVARNRALAGQLLAAADAWLFVTTAARYADAVPWELLDAARRRATALAMVLNRVPDDALEEVPVHLRAMLGEHGLGDAPLLVVPESQLAGDLLPPQALAPVRAWLDGLAADAQARGELVRRTLAGALDSLAPRVESVAAAAEQQLAAAVRLREEVEQAYAGGLADVDDAVRSGALLRGEVLARWHDIVGTGDLMRALETRIGRIRDRLRSALTGKPTAQAELEAVVETSLDSIVLAAADRAAERAAEAWSALPAGRAALARGDRLEAASPGLPAAISDEIRAWQGYVFDLVREEGADRRTTARLASLGVNGAGLTVMLAVFLQTGGLTGAEIVVAGGTTAVGQKVLEAIFGDQAVRALAAKAREELLERVERLLAGEAKRFDDVLAPLVPPEGAPGRLRSALAAVEAAR
jgi:energy-coupling factor transporter ATP-binding protein EcfA2